MRDSFLLLSHELTMINHLLGKLSSIQLLTLSSVYSITCGIKKKNHLTSLTTGNVLKDKNKSKGWCRFNHIGYLLECVCSFNGFTVCHSWEICTEKHENIMENDIFFSCLTWFKEWLWVINFIVTLHLEQRKGGVAN